MLSINENIKQRLIEQMEENFGKDVWQDTSMPLIVSKLDTPALVIHDTDDIDVPIEEGQVIADAWKDASFISTNSLGHRRILRDAEVVGKTVEFITS
jgi:pimeloyl-ACP methyl ester carboxylesterase